MSDTAYAHYAVYQCGVCVRSSDDPIEAAPELEWPTPEPEPSSPISSDISDSAGPWKAISEFPGYEQSGSTRVIRSWLASGRNKNKNRGRADRPHLIRAWLHSEILCATLKTPSGHPVRRSISHWFRLTWADME